MNNEITALVEKYIEGTRDGNIPLLREVFSEKAVMTGDLPHVKLIAESPELFFKDIEGKTVGNDYQSEIFDVTEFGESAIASLKESNLHGLNFVNHFHLIKTEGEWKIISKLFSAL